MTKDKAEVTTETEAKPNGAAEPKQERRGVSNPNDVASLILMQVDAVNTKKDDLTIAIKGLTDLTKQLTRAYAEHTNTIQKLAEKIQELEKQ